MDAISNAVADTDAPDNETVDETAAPLVRSTSLATPGDPCAILWCGDYLPAGDLLASLAVAREWRAAGASAKFWARSCRVASRAACVDALACRERVRASCAKYSALLAQHKAAEVAYRRDCFGTPPDPERVNVRYGSLNSVDPLAHHAVYVVEAETELAAAVAARAALDTPCGDIPRGPSESGVALRSLLDAAARGTPWAGELTVPAGLDEFLELCDRTNEMKVGDLTIDFEEQFWGRPRFHATEAGALLILAGNAYRRPRRMLDPSPRNIHVRMRDPSLRNSAETGRDDAAAAK